MPKSCGKTHLALKRPVARLETTRGNVTISRVNHLGKDVFATIFRQVNNAVHGGYSRRQIIHRRVVKLVDKLVRVCLESLASGENRERMIRYGKG